jgi:hypothetical protein
MRGATQPIVTLAITDTLLKETFDEARSQLLVDTICEKVMGGAAALSLPMKFVGA